MNMRQKWVEGMWGQQEIKEEIRWTGREAKGKDEQE